MKLRVFAMLLSLLVAQPALALPDQLLTESLAAVRDSEKASIAKVSILSGRLLADFYAKHQNQLVWSDPQRVIALSGLIEASPGEGFVPEDFHAELVRAMSKPGALDALPEPERVIADILLSDALLRYVHHTRFGKLDPRAVDSKWNDRAAIPSEQLLADMQGALEAPDMAAFMASRLEVPFWYDQLRRALHWDARLAALPPLDPLPPGKVLVRGDRDPRVPALRERLSRLGDAPPATALTAEPELFDDALREAVVAFQRSVSLRADGVVGPGTLAAMQSPPDQGKNEQIRINLERMRWLYNDLPADYVFVDVANYQLHVVRDGKVVWTTRVVVGATDAQTPMFRDSMDHLVFNPTWTVPVSIQKTMGRLSARYSLVDRQNGRKVSGGNAGDYKRYRIVQEPGPTNALGRVKFMFPNRHSVYLHDTPSKALFGRSARALSHGCVRVQNPVRLAEIILGEQRGWDPERIKQTIDTSRTRYVTLNQELPVLLYYLTARADEQGRVGFRPDIYDRDQRLRESFARPVLSARIAFPELPAPPAENQPGPTLPPSDEEQPDDVPRQESPSITPPSQNGVHLSDAGPSAG